MRILRNTDSKCILLKDLTFTYTVIILKTVYIQVQEYSKRNRKGALHIKVSLKDIKRFVSPRVKGMLKNQELSLTTHTEIVFRICLCNIGQGMIMRATVKLPSHHKHTSKS